MIEWLLLTFETFKKKKNIEDRIKLFLNNVWNKIKKYYEVIDLFLYYIIVIVVNSVYK